MKTSLSPSFFPSSLSISFVFPSPIHKFWSSWAIIERERKIVERESWVSECGLFFCFLMKGVCSFYVSSFFLLRVFFLDKGIG